MNLDHSYALELSDLGSQVKPAGIKNARLIHVNQPLRQALQLPSSWFGSQGKEQTIRQQQMKQCNPNYVLRNYLAQLAIDDSEQGDFGKFETLLKVLQQPFDDLPQYAQYAKPPPNWGKHLKISCSS